MRQIARSHPVVVQNGERIAGRPHDAIAVLPDSGSADNTRAASGRALAYLVLGAGMLLFAASTTHINWVKYISLRSTWPLDLALYNNVAANAAAGRLQSYVVTVAWFDKQDYNGPSVYRATHFSPFQTFIMPAVYRLAPSILTLMLVQSIVIALGALPLFWLGSDRTGDSRLGLILGLSYLLHPAILHTAFNDYRPVSIGIAPFLFTLWFYVTRRHLLFVLASLLTLACRPEYALLLPFFGLLTWRQVGGGWNARWLILPILIAVLWAGLTDAYYQYAYGRSWPILAHNPDRKPLVEQVGEIGERLPILLRIGLLPAVLGTAIVPESLAVVLPVLAVAKDVYWPSFPHHHLQHLSPALAVMMWAFASGVVWLWARARQPRLRAWLQGLLVGAALLSFADFGWGAAGAYLVGGHPRYDELTGIDNALPWDATVLVTMDLSARLSNHARVLTPEMLPTGDARNISSREARDISAALVSICDLVAIKRDQTSLNDLVARSGRYEPARVIGKYRVFVARSDAPRADNPDARLQQILRWDRLDQWKSRWL